MSTALQIQLIVIVLYGIDYSVDLDNGILEVSSSWVKNLAFVGCHAVLFLLVTQVLVPRLLYTRRFLLFGLAVFAAVTLMAGFEETMLERWMYPTSRGLDDLSVSSVLYFYGEISFPFLTMISLKLLIDADESRIRVKELERERLDNELRLLRSQIQPHVLFNSLNNLYEYILRGERTAPDLVLRLSHVLRYVLYETGDAELPLEREVNFLEDYLTLQQMQLEGRGSVTYQLAVPDRNDVIAPFLLIPFVENCFKHSLGTLPTGIDIKVALQIEGNQLTLRTSNNFDPERLSSQSLTHSGIGLANVRKRLRLLYPNRHALRTQVTAGVYHVRFELNLAE